MNVEDYVGPQTLERMRQTKWWALARFIDQVLYSGGDVHAEGSAASPMGYERLRKPKEGDSEYARKFIVGARQYVSGVPSHIKILGRDGDYFDVQKTLRELAHECERMAMKEST